MDNTIIHLEIPATDITKLKQSYAGLFNWKIEKYPGPIEYWMIQTDPTDDKGMLLRPEVKGGMTKKEHPNQKPVNYISVESIEKVKKKTRRKNSHAKTSSPKRRMDSNRHRA